MSKFTFEMPLELDNGLELTLAVTATRSKHRAATHLDPAEPSETDLLEVLWLSKNLATVDLLGTLNPAQWLEVQTAAENYEIPQPEYEND